MLAEQSTARTAPAEGEEKKGTQATPAAPAEAAAAPPEGTTPPAAGTASELPPTPGSADEPTAALAAGEAAVAATLVPSPAALA
ncbi:MAG TPA: hypothetical protein VHA80_09395, partial [Solirubrobacterales bacterium]|nr:hypothetical protein [Solirubrobacterales bacterium]